MFWAALISFHIVSIAVEMISFHFLIHSLTLPRCLVRTYSTFIDLDMHTWAMSEFLRTRTTHPLIRRRSPCMRSFWNRTACPGASWTLYIIAQALMAIARRVDNCHVLATHPMCLLYYSRAPKSSHGRANRAHSFQDFLFLLC
jgi:hypothetical protein